MNQNKEMSIMYTQSWRSQLKNGGGRVETEEGLRTACPVPALNWESRSLEQKTVMQQGATLASAQLFMFNPLEQKWANF